MGKILANYCNQVTVPFLSFLLIIFSLFAFMPIFSHSLILPLLLSSFSPPSRLYFFSSPHFFCTSLYKRVCPEVCPSVRLSVQLSVTAKFGRCKICRKSDFSVLLPLPTGITAPAHPQATTNWPYIRPCSSSAFAVSQECIKLSGFCFFPTHPSPLLPCRV